MSVYFVPTSRDGVITKGARYPDLVSQSLTPSSILLLPPTPSFENMSNIRDTSLSVPPCQTVSTLSFLPAIGMNENAISLLFIIAT